MIISSPIQIIVRPLPSDLARTLTSKVITYSDLGLNKQSNSEIVSIYFQVGWKKGDHCLALWRDGQVIDVFFPLIAYHILMEDRDIRDL